MPTDPYLYLFWFEFIIVIWGQSQVFRLLQDNRKTIDLMKTMTDMNEVLYGRLLEYIKEDPSALAPGQTKNMEASWRPTVEMPIVSRQFKSLADFSPHAHRNDDDMGPLI